MRQGPEITALLQAWSRGDADALDALAPVVQRELRMLARGILASERERWQPTELVNEAYIRLLGWRAVRWQNRAHFFGTAARMMRRTLVDAARARQTRKRGADLERVSLTGIADQAASVHFDLVALSEALDTLARVDQRASQVIELRFFGGFSVEETADALGVSVRTVINDWNAARVWLYRELTTDTAQ